LVVFRKLSLDNLQTAQILIAPVRDGSAAREAVIDGKHGDDEPQFPADVDTVYFTSTRDEYLCIWARRLDPMTKRPRGSPFAFEKSGFR
jgi:hypothetical protein